MGCAGSKQEKGHEGRRMNGLEHHLSFAAAWAVAAGGFAGLIVAVRLTRVPVRIAARGSNRKRGRI